MKNKKDLSDLLQEVRNSFKYRLESLTQTFSDELWLAMSARELSQAQLARNAGVGRQFLTRVFRGKPNLTLKTMEKLAEAVGHRLCLHLAPAEVNCEWIHVIKSDSHESILGTTTDLPDALVSPLVVVNAANQELALAA
jgi:transcriptional regulator with XRE-family HTH domain